MGCLIKCPDCGKQISKSAPACPDCGRTMKKGASGKGEGCFLQTLNIGCVIFFIITALVVAAVIFIIKMV